MISVLKIPLSQQESDAIRAWMDLPQAARFLEIVNAKVASGQAQAANEALQADVFPNYEISASDALTRVAPYRHLVQAWMELKKSTGVFETIELEVQNEFSSILSPITTTPGTIVG